MSSAPTSMAAGATVADGPLIRIRGLVKTFEGGRVRALDGVDLEVGSGEFIAIVGPSGCGKSTLLNLIAALDTPTEGTIEVAGHDLRRHRELNHFRAQDVGLVFQLDNLLPSLSARDNVQVPMFGQGRPAAERRARADELLRFVGLEGRASTRPPQLSGGERQRVAIARALANEPGIVLADEPTGRLDSVTSERVLDLLESLRREQGVTVVVVTHEPAVAARADRIVHMLDGRVVDVTRGDGPGAGSVGSARLG